jgi:hypothetical protein
MLRILRSRSVSLAILTAFLVGQPAALCAALCMVEQHHGPMPAMAHGTGASDSDLCHGGVRDASRQDRPQMLSPMVPTRVVVLAPAPERRAEPPSIRPAFPRTAVRPADPPPPRLV